MSDKQTDGAMDVIREITVFPVKVPVLKTFNFASGSAGQKGEMASLVYLRVEDSGGSVGWGECRPVHQWSSETIETVVSTIETYLAPALAGHPVSDIVGAHERMNAAIQRGPGTGQPIAKAAVDMAIYDLQAKKAGLPLRELLGGSRARRTVKLSFTVTASDTAAIRDEVQTASARGFVHFNFKAGLNRKQDIAAAQTLRDCLPPGGFLWADANQGYNLTDAKYCAAGFQDIGVDLLEQPLRADHMSAMAELRRVTHIPLAIDEASVSPANFFEYVRAGLVDYLVIKVTRSGGLEPSLQQIATARAAGLELVVSGLSDGMLTKLAACQLASVFGFTGPAALNGSQFIDDSGIFPEKSSVEDGGTVELNDEPGIGLVPEPGDR